MATKKKKAAPKSKTKARGKAKTTQTNKREPPAKMIVRRNAAPARKRPKKDEEVNERIALSERVEGMAGSHVAAGIGFGALGNVVGVVAVGQGWIGPKMTAGLLMGTGAATTAAGWYWEWDHVMAAGVGLASAGAFSIANQFSIDAYEAMEKRADENRAKKEAEQEAKDKAKRLAEARALLAAEKQKPRNGRRVVVLGQDGEPLDIPMYSAA